MSTPASNTCVDTTIRPFSGLSPSNLAGGLVRLASGRNRECSKIASEKPCRTALKISRARETVFTMTSVRVPGR